MSNTPNDQTTRPLWVLGLLLQLLLVVTAIFLFQSVHSPEFRRYVVPMLLAAFVPYLLGVGWLKRLPATRILPGILLFAVLFRLTFLFVPPVLSAGVYRSLWEGRVQSIGANPYLDAPNADRFNALDPALRARVDSPSIPAVDLPLSELGFRLAGAIWSGGPWLLKLIFAGLDLGVIWLLVRLLRLQGFNENAVILYAWCPLPVLEFACHGHALPLAMFLTLAAVYLAMPQRSETRWAGVWEQGLAALSAGGALASHFMVWPLLPLLARQIQCRFWPLMFLVPVLFFLPFREAGPHLFDGFYQCANSNRFNESLFGILAAGFNGQWLPWSADNIWWSQLIAKHLAAYLWLGVLVIVLLSRLDILRSVFVLSGACLLLSPYVTPWLLVWMIPWLCFRPNYGWILLSGSVLLSYTAGFDSREPAAGFHGLKLIEYVPALTLMLWYLIEPYLLPGVEHEIDRQQM